jgi:hypothetical protein
LGTWDNKRLSTPPLQPYHKFLMLAEKFDIRKLHLQNAGEGSSERVSGISQVDQDSNGEKAAVGFGLPPSGFRKDPCFLQPIKCMSSKALIISLELYHLDNRQGSRQPNFFYEVVVR